MDLTWDGDADRRRRAIDNAVAVGARVSRNSLLWHNIERQQGRLDWSHTDAVVRELEAAGIEPLFVVYGSPPWSNPETDSDYLQVPQDADAFSRWLAAYADFVRAAAHRYGGTVHRWQIGNEQNEANFWRPAPDVDQYVLFYTALRSAILREQPEAEVAVGGLAGLSATGAGNFTGLSFLEQLLSRDVPIDYVGVHPYPSQGQGPDEQLEWENNFSDIEAVHELLRERGVSAPLWVTEWGWSSERVGVEAQAAHVARSLEMLRDAYPYVAVATLFLDYDRPPEYYYGLFDSSLEPKPAAFEFASFSEALIEAAGP